jgi:lipopolysaccharide biosynthesis glycosyltransferase
MSLIDNENLVWEEEVKLSTSNKPIVVVCAADNNYAMPLAVTMRSALENLKSDHKILFFIIDGGITDLNKQKILKSLIPEKCEVEYIQISDSLILDLTEVHKPIESQIVSTKANYVSIASFYRLLIPKLLPEQLEKVIYLDCDLVVKEDLEQLWQIDIGENYVLAVRDTWIPSISSPTGNLNYQELGLDPDAPYFNAGILVINLNKWRANSFSTKAIEYFRQNQEYIGWYDQGLLNALLVGQWGQLDPRWNFNATSFYDYASAGYLSWENIETFLSEDIYQKVVREPYIIHFVSAKKPWTSRHCPRKEDFFKYVDMTAWSGWRLTILRRLWRRLNHEFNSVFRRIGFGR